MKDRLIEKTSHTGAKQFAYRLLSPSFFGLFNYKVKSAWSDDVDLIKENNNYITDLQKKVGKVSQKLFIHLCLQNQLDPTKQLEILKQNKRNFNIFSYSFILFLSASVVIYSYSLLTHQDMMIWVFISAISTMQTLLGMIKYGHRYKQIAIGAIFPRNYMITNYRNLLFLDGPLYRFSKIVFYPTPFVGEFYDNLIILEGKPE